MSVLQLPDKATIIIKRGNASFIKSPAIVLVNSEYSMVPPNTDLYFDVFPSKNLGVSISKNMHLHFALQPNQQVTLVVKEGITDIRFLYKYAIRFALWVLLWGYVLPIATFTSMSNFKSIGLLLVVSYFMFKGIGKDYFQLEEE
jgi:alanine-alpha-ketoisovalerate/valine-pyruvate aminotransferase